MDGTNLVEFKEEIMLDSSHSNGIVAFSNSVLKNSELEANYEVEEIKTNLVDAFLWIFFYSLRVEN